MLELKAFDAGMDLLEENYERKISPRIRRIWFEYLDENLNKAEFAEAIRHSILHNRFMPTAADLVAHIHGTKEAQALIEWQQIVKASSSASPKEQLTYLSLRARTALQAIGGIFEIGKAEEFRRDRLEKSFVTVYCQCSDKDTRMLAQESTSAPEKRQQGTSEAASMPSHIKEQMEGLKDKFAAKGNGKKC